MYKITSFDSFFHKSYLSTSLSLFINTEIVTITHDKCCLGEYIMKKALMISIFASSILFSSEAIQPDRMKNMSEMETAMATIQKGFLYDNVNVVKNGVVQLKKTVKFTESFIKEGVGENKINNKVYAHKVAEQIDSMADEILVTFKKGDRYSAANNYLLILSKCLSCHQTVRSW